MELFKHQPLFAIHRKRDSFFDERIAGVIQNVSNVLYRSLPREWDGRKAILEMKEANYPQWKQLEWIGFYFQFLCERKLSGIMRIPGPKYGRVRFDAYNVIPWDFKSHAINTTNHKVIINDKTAVERGIRDYGALGVMLALGKVEYNDESRDFQRWHEELKGEKSRYTIEREQRGAWSRLRKVAFELKQICFIVITKDVIERCGIFQKNFRNSNGLPRKEKILLDLESLDDKMVYFVDF